MEFNFSYEKESLHFGLDESVTIAWVLKILESENKIPGNISYFFCTDTYLLDINQKYLNHDTYTDIITFDYVEGKLISGDILISLDRVRENANSFQTGFKNELQRVMAHGLLHLMGYKDKTPEEQALMREKEDFCLTLHPSK